MAFIRRHLIRIASLPYDDAGTTRKCNIYRYATKDALATVATAGYFNDARSILKVDDRIIVEAAIAGSSETEVYRFTAVPATGNVTVAVSQIDATA